MSNDEYSYKPRLGFDIRIKPGKEKTGGIRRARTAQEDVQACEHEGCALPAQSRAAKSPTEPGVYVWLCAAHAREHNRNWNFFAGKSDAEAARIREQSRYGDRPTWSMAQNGRAAAARAKLGSSQTPFEDQAGLTDGIRPPVRDEGIYREGRRLTRLQVQAFRTLNLKPSASSAEIRKRYAELVKRFHPDANEGDRSAEAQLQDVIKAHQLLKKANFI